MYGVKVDDQEKFIKNIEGRISVKLEAKNEQVIVQPEDADAFVNEVNNLVKQGVIMLRELKPLSPTLEDIFVEVLRRKSYATE
jgi:hypothetical protein